MLITVAICTWNRSALLDQTLARMRELVVPDGVTWELLVVNNSCTDRTDEVLAAHAGGLPLRRLFEPKQGHSNARNCAIDHAQGGLLVWTDDDVLVEPDWLTAYLDAAAAFPGAAFFGGTVEPWFEAPPPPWVARHLGALEGPFALRRYGPEVRRLGDREEVFGANMAFRTEFQRRVRFDPALGRVGTGMLSGDETAVMTRLREEGHYGVWVGTARVRHFIPAERMTAAYLWKYFHGLGRTSQRGRPLDRGGPQLFGAPRWLVRKYLTQRARSVLLAPWGGAEWLSNYTGAAATRGIIDECRVQSGGAPCG